MQMIGRALKITHLVPYFNLHPYRMYANIKNEKFKSKYLCTTLWDGSPTGQGMVVTVPHDTDRVCDAQFVL